MTLAPSGTNAAAGKKVTRCQRVLRALQAAGSTGCTTAELCHPAVGGSRFGGRILNLRQVGHDIASVYEREGSFRYTLQVAANAPAPDPRPPAAQPTVSAMRPPADAAAQSTLFEFLADAA